MTFPDTAMAAKLAELERRVAELERRLAAVALILTPLPPLRATPAPPSNAPAETPNPRDEGLWTVVDTAKYLSVTKSWVYRHVESGDLPHAKFGALIRFKPSIVREYAARLTASVTTPSSTRARPLTPKPKPRTKRTPR